MSRKIVCKNYLNEEVIFEYEFPFCLTNIEGIHDIVGTISSVKSAYAIGETYVDTNVEKRNIIITGIIVSDFIKNRNKLYKVFPLKKTGTFYYYEENLERKISYQVENVNCPDKGFPKVFQISLICLYPYFTDIKNTVLKIAEQVAMFTFPLFIPKNKGVRFGAKNKAKMVYINNDTELEFGFTIIFKANGNLKKPYLFNVDSQEEIKIDKEMKAGEKIIITTHRKNKNIIFITSNGEKENINNYMTYGSKFLQVHSGNNTFRHGADEGENYLETTIEYAKEYEAI